MSPLWTARSFLWSPLPSCFFLWPLFCSVSRLYSVLAVSPWHTDLVCSIVPARYAPNAIPSSFMESLSRNISSSIFHLGCLECLFGYIHWLLSVTSCILCSFMIFSLFCNLGFHLALTVFCNLCCYLSPYSSQGAVLGGWTECWKHSVCTIICFLGAPRLFSSLHNSSSLLSVPIPLPMEEPFFHYVSFQSFIPVPERWLEDV